ncbi:WD40-repeat-containing domain protein [Schizophyllum commune]
MTTKYLDTLKDLDNQRDGLYSRLREGDSPDGADQELLALMSAVCNNLRHASIDPTANDTMPELAAATHIALAKMVDMAYSSSCGDLFDSLPSYTGDAAPLIRDPDHEANLVSSMGAFGDMCLRLMSRALGLPADVDRAAREALPRPAAFDATPKPHNNTSPLARFRDADAVPDIPSSAPIAQAVYYGSCSISSHRLGPRPCMIANAPNSDVMAIAAYDGDRQMDPFTCFYDLASVDGWAGTPKMHYINNGLLDVCYDIAVDPTRKLIWAVDDQRAKSFRYSEDGETLAVHTLKCGKRSGPIALINDGSRILRGGKGGVDVWNVDDLPTHGPKGNQRIGKGKISLANTWRDLEYDYVERSTGAPRASSIDFDGSIETWHIPSWWREGGTLKALTAGNEARTTVTARDMEDQGKVTAYYTGHGGFFNTITSSDADPNAFLTATTDSLVRLFDVRQPLPQLTFDCGESSISKIVAHYMHVDGLPVIVTGGENQGIKVWDPRARKLVYELATGNNSVVSFVWDAPRSTLYAATRCEGYNDRTGRRERYREARARAGIHDHRGMQPPPPPQPVGEDDYLYDKAWPMQCAHDEKYFGYAWDCGEHRLIRYKFGLDADATVVPEYGDAYPSIGGGYSDW